MNQTVKILVIEDEKNILSFITSVLSSQHYQVIPAATGTEGLSLASSQCPDLILLDLGLPDIDGMEVISKIREWSSVPILVISARALEDDKVLALDAGADDYITKPFGNSELLARIRTALRHSSRMQTDGELADRPYRSKGLMIDFEKRIVSRDGKEIHLTQNEYKIEAKLDYSRILSSMGFFKEALAITNSMQQEQLSPRLKAEYFLGQVTIYNHQKAFASNEDDSQENDLIAQIYRDSLLQCKEIPTNVRAFMTAPTLLFHKKYDDAIHILDSTYQSYTPYSRNAGIIAYSLASAYQGKNDRENTIKYFAISAISDVLNGARENLSLKILAKLIFESGDIDRASKYMKNAMEDAILCNARINTIEASDMYLFIDKAFQEKEKHKFIIITALLIALCIVCILLFILSVQLKKQKGKVEQANESLSYHLYEIQQMNSILADNNKIKEEYVGLYMEQYTSYISKIANFKKRALKIAKSEDIKKVTSFLHSSLNTEEDLAEFYNNFDKAILNLFPNFVEDFNALLLPENAIIPGPGKLLTPELRIFALIRLGITDSVKIAHFLQYSLSTIYNYRSKMRIKANGDRNEFEEKVARIGQQIRE